MLKYKVNLNEPKGYDEIPYSELYLSHDLSFISGVTSPLHGLVNGQDIKIEYNENGVFHDAMIETKEVLRQGFVVVPYSFDVKTTEDELHEYIEYVDGKYYFFGEEQGKKVIYVQGKKAVNEIKDGTIVIPTKFWIEDGQFTIDDSTFDVTFHMQNARETNDNGEEVIKFNHECIEPPRITIFGGVTVIPHIWSQEKWQRLIKFTIRKTIDPQLTVDSVSMAKKQRYINYLVVPQEDLMDKSLNYGSEGEKIYIEKAVDNTDGKIVGSEYIVLDDKVLIVEDQNGITINGMYYPIQEEWINTDNNATRVHLFCDSIPYDIQEGHKILAHSKNVETLFYHIVDLTDKTKRGIVFGGKEYPLSDEDDTIDCITVGDNEYVLTYFNNKANAYISMDDSLFSFIINGDKAKQVLANETNLSYRYGIADSNKEYEITKYNYVTINEEYYLARHLNKIQDSEENENDIYGVYLDIQPTYELIVDEVVGNNVLRCYNLYNPNGSFDVYSALASNGDFEYRVFRDLIPPHNVDVKSYYSPYSDSVLDTIKFFNPTHYISIPLLCGNDMVLNLQQEDVLENNFFATEIEKSINPIVDMEKEIYYPCVKSGDTISNICELIFDLHFRTRDLTTWKINDYTGDDEAIANKVYVDDSITEDDKIKDTWNCNDWYADDLKEEWGIKTVDNKIKIDKPIDVKPDLLCFLGFNNDDIYYQKSKVGKSFLRLLFFDSNDPQNQQLLSTSTIWMDEGSYFKTYLNYIVDNPSIEYYAFDGEKLIGEDTSGSTYHAIGVNTEPQPMSGNTDNRLSAQLHVKNRYEATESAEGFYLRMFKEYCQCEENDLYMKIEFNHAGWGRTLNFTLGLADDSLDGVSLRDLYKNIFIPLKCKYDKATRKYYYYFDNDKFNKTIDYNKDKGSLRFSLFELKIKDESKWESKAK